ncbi:MAG TPA: hypothetical protein VKE94_04165 [Gemmataceae bacterium]|nr:hypothetical protein [Gemmataceae bacterium]
MKNLFWLTSMLLVVLCGCGKDKPQQADVEGGLRKNIPIFDRVMTEIMLKNIKEGFLASPGVAPRTIEELEQVHGDPKITKAIKDGLLVVVLGVSPERQPADAILAYPAKPDPGGERVVLTCGGNIVPMDEKTFAAAPKAQAK